jgi:hypothetical protein
VIVEVDNQGAIILLVPVLECSLSFENSFLTLVLVLALVVVVLLLLLLHTQTHTSGVKEAAVLPLSTDMLCIY